LLSDYNGGKGVTPGAFKITNSTGQQFTFNISTNQVSLGDVISLINSRGAGVTASINSSGNGLSITDNAGGQVKLKVEEVDATTAADLNIKGTATDAAPGVIDGALQKTI